MANYQLNPKVISASRRTDMPAHYYDWLINSFDRGLAEVQVPRRKGMNKVILTPETIHSIVFWSKNFSKLIADPNRWTKYQLFFQFTLNSMPNLEPNIPSLEIRLKQMADLANIWGAERINWRFDPIVFWDEGKKNNVDTFFELAPKIRNLGIIRMSFSFMTSYRKVVNRSKKYQLGFYEPTLTQKQEIAIKMAETAAKLGLEIAACCHPGLIGIGGIKKAKCIDGELLSQITGQPGSLAKDTSQRSACGCTKSVDIGSYWMTCPNGCLYCYAQPKID